MVEQFADGFAIVARDKFREPKQIGDPPEQEASAGQPEQGLGEAAVEVNVVRAEAEPGQISVSPFTATAVELGRQIVGDERPAGIHELSVTQYPHNGALPTRLLDKLF
jgi:hypothetical protein